jgi:hypothetical protein
MGAKDGSRHVGFRRSLVATRAHPSRVKGSESAITVRMILRRQRMPKTGFFVSFPDVVSAVACAREIQRKLVDHRREHGFAPQIRIGLHAAEATKLGANYSGMGVHTAARIGAIAGAGEIVASASSIDGLESRTDGWWISRGSLDPSRSSPSTGPSPSSPYREPVLGPTPTGERRPVTDISGPTSPPTHDGGPTHQRWWVGPLAMITARSRSLNFEKLKNCDTVFSIRIDRGIRALRSASHRAANGRRYESAPTTTCTPRRLASGHRWLLHRSLLMKAILEPSGALCNTPRSSTTERSTTCSKANGVSASPR